MKKCLLVHSECLVYFNFSFVTRYCDHLKSTGNSALIQPYLPEVVNSLLSMATQYNEDVLSLVLETLAIALSVSFSMLHNSHTTTLQYY